MGDKWNNPIFTPSPRDGDRGWRATGDKVRGRELLINMEFPETGLNRIFGPPLETTILIRRTFPHLTLRTADDKENPEWHQMFYHKLSCLDRSHTKERLKSQVNACPQGSSTRSWLRHLVGLFSNRESVTYILSRDRSVNGHRLTITRMCINHSFILFQVSLSILHNLLGMEIKL